MGLGAAGVLGWQTAVAFSLGADLGTTITSWIASLNLSKNAKRAAYAHIAFNIIGVAVMLPLFFPAMQLLTWAMGWFGGDPGVPVIRDGHETFPLVPVAVGVYSTAFNVFNTILLFPFVGVFERVLSQVGREATDAAEDYSVPRFLVPTSGRDLATGVPLVQQEMARYVEGAALFLVMARREKPLPGAARDHQNAIDILSRDIRRYTAAMFEPGMPHGQADLLASLIEEGDFTASLGESLHQVARRLERQPFSAAGRELVEATLTRIEQAIRPLLGVAAGPGARVASDAGGGSGVPGGHPRAVPGLGGRPALGGARRDSRAAGQRRARPVPDRPDHRGAPVGAAGGARAGRNGRASRPSRARARVSREDRMMPAPARRRLILAAVACVSSLQAVPASGQDVLGETGRGAPGRRSSTRCCHAGRASTAPGWRAAATTRGSTPAWTIRRRARRSNTSRWARWPACCA